MNTIKQLIRRPLKTLCGLLLMTLATAVLCISAGQALAAETTAENLNKQFTTIVMPAGSASGTASALALPKELRTWLDEMAVEYPDIVKSISKHGLLSAYIPELTPMNFTTKDYGYENTQSDAENFGFQASEPSPKGMPYSCAMMVIELETVNEPTALHTVYFLEGWKNTDEFDSYWEWKDYFYNWGRVEAEVGYSMVITGTIKQVVSLQEGFRDPTGKTARLSLTARTAEELLSYDLVPGQQYIVYGMDYYDADWALRSYMLEKFGRQIDAFDMSKMYVLTPEEREAYYEANKKEAVARYDGSMYMNQTEYQYANAVVMSLAHPISRIEYEDIWDEEGKLLELRPITDYSYIGADGETIPCSEEEFIQRYQIPTIAHLEGTVEDFLQSSEGSQWRSALERAAINNQAFGVIGVDKLSYLTQFALGKSRVVEGRDFTDEELSNGSRVCIISEALAAANGLQIGDTVTLNFYQTDSSLPYMDTLGLLDPNASFYFSTTPFTETAEYTIVGFVRSDRVWPDVTVNAYAFSPNIIFVPNSSVQTEMEHRTSVLFTTPVLQNGKIEEFQKLATVAGYQKYFVYQDQGYSIIAQNFHNYQDLAKQVVTIGAVVYGVLLLLFLLLYPGTQRKQVNTMQSLGASYGKRFAVVLTSSALMLVCTTVLGGLAGAMLWDRVVVELQASAEAATQLQIEPGTLWMIAAVQLGFAMLLNILVALTVAAPKGLSRRRK